MTYKIIKSIKTPKGFKIPKLSKIGVKKSTIKIKLK